MVYYIVIFTTLNLAAQYFNGRELLAASIYEHSIEWRVLLMTLYKLLTRLQNFIKGK